MRKRGKCMYEACRVYIYPRFLFPGYIDRKRVVYLMFIYIFWISQYIHGIVCNLFLFLFKFKKQKQFRSTLLLSQAVMFESLQTV